MHHAASEDFEGAIFLSDTARLCGVVLWTLDNILFLVCSKSFGLIIPTTMVDQNLRSAEKIGFPGPKKSTGNHAPRSESNVNQDDIDLAAFESDRS